MECFQIPASVISSTGTTNYQQLIVVSKDSNVKETSTSSTNITNDNVNNNSSKTMIQQSINVQAPRLHPKKRKFDLSELEDADNSAATSSASNVTTICNPITSPPEKISVVYKTSTESNGNQPQQQQQQNFSPYNHTQQQQQNIVTQVVKNTGEVQQLIKRQFTNYR